MDDSISCPERDNLECLAWLQGLREHIAEQADGFRLVAKNDAKVRSSTTCRLATPIAARCCKRAGTSPVNAAVRETIIKRQDHFRSSD